MIFIAVKGEKNNMTITGAKQVALRYPACECGADAL